MAMAIVGIVDVCIWPLDVCDIAVYFDYNLSYVEVGVCDAVLIGR